MYETGYQISGYFILFVIAPKSLYAFQFSALRQRRSFSLLAKFLKQKTQWCFLYVVAKAEKQTFHSFI